MALGHLAVDGLDDIFRPPLLNAGVELEFIQKNSRFVKQLRRRTIDFLNKPSQDGFRPLLHLKVPKTRFAYRQASLIDIVDLVRYTTLVASIAPTIEANRVPSDLSIVFSYRYSEGIPFILPDKGYDRFRAQSHVLSANGDFQVKVVSDISNFYDRLNLHRLEGVLAEIGCEPKCVTAVNQILLHWSGRNSYGIPVGCDASRILAEAMLIPVDNVLISRGIPFVRYVDDFRLFAHNYAEAHSHLNVLINALEAEGLFINSEKTRLLSCLDSAEDGTLEENVPARDFDAIDESERIPHIIRIRSRYSSRISTVYKKPGEDAIRKLRLVNLEELITELDSNDALEDRLRLFVKAFIYRDEHDVDLLIRFVSRHIHMLGYTVSALIREHSRIGVEGRHRVSVAFEHLYDHLAETEYYRLCIARLLSDEHYSRSGIFGRWFARLRPDVSPLYIRELIGFFRGKFSPSEVKQLVAYSHNAHCAVQRVIVVSALESLALQGQKSAWAKTWLHATDDPLIKGLCQELLFGKEK